MAFPCLTAAKTRHLRAADTGHGSLAFQAVDVGDPQPGQVQVAVAAWCINTQDLAAKNAAFKPLPGIEFSGVVVAVGGPRTQGDQDALDEDSSEQEDTQFNVGDMVTAVVPNGGFSSRQNVGILCTSFCTPY